MGAIPTVRVARPEDAEAFASCQLQCWREAYGELWGQERFDGLDVNGMAKRRRAEIEKGLATYYLGEAEGETIAVAIAGPTRDEDEPTETELYAIYVREAFHGSGVADQLMEATIDGVAASLWTYRDNPRSSAFYVHHGFIPDGSERTDSEGILQIRMVRRSQPAA